MEEDRIFYWLANINVMKKSAIVLHWPHSQTLGEPSAELQTKSKQPPHFYNSVGMDKSRQEMLYCQSTSQANW